MLHVFVFEKLEVRLKFCLENLKIETDEGRYYL